MRGYGRGGATYVGELHGAGASWEADEVFGQALRCSEVGADGVWLSPGVALRRSWWTAGGDLMVVQHPWGWQLRPELWTGAQWSPIPSWSVGAAVGVLPVRDVVYDGDQLRYDSGRAQLTAELLWTPRENG